MKNGELVHRSTYLLQKKCTYCLTQPNASKSGLFMCSSDIDTAKNISFPNSFQVKPKLHMANMWNHTKCNISTRPASPCLCSRGKWTVSDSLCFHKTLPINALSSSLPAGERDVTISLPKPCLKCLKVVECKHVKVVIKLTENSFHRVKPRES